MRGAGIGDTFLPPDFRPGLRCFVALLSLLDPIHAVPLCLAMGPSPPRERNREGAVVAGLTVLVTLLVSLFIGQQLLAFSGVTNYAFQVGGGILILLLALAMLEGKVSGVKQTPEELREASYWKSIAVVPLGLPILVGAGAISTVILFAHRARNGRNWAGLSVAVVSNAYLAYGALRLSRRLRMLLGNTGIDIISRLTGLSLVAMAAQFPADGIRGLFPGLGHTH